MKLKECHGPAVVTTTYILLTPQPPTFHAHHTPCSVHQKAGPKLTGVSSKAQDIPTSQPGPTILPALLYSTLLYYTSLSRSLNHILPLSLPPLFFFTSYPLSLFIPLTDNKREDSRDLSRLTATIQSSSLIARDPLSASSSTLSLSPPARYHR